MKTNEDILLEKKSLIFTLLPHPPFHMKMRYLPPQKDR